MKNNRSFLRQTAEYYCEGKDDLSNVLFVFPSHRAISFFTAALGETVRDSRRGAILAPQMLSINDFFASMSELSVSDKVTLLLDLYEAYRRCSQGMRIESLDEFLFWGDVILSDFDDVDKYMVNADDLFRNVSQYKDMQGDYSDLSEAQKAAISRLLRLFAENQKGGGVEFKNRFASLWNRLAPMYHTFNDLLDKRGGAYEGRLYRRLVESLDTEGAESLLKRAFPGCEKVVFCGLNALNECEKKFLRRLRDIGVAEFCWDYSDGMISDPHNKSSFFMKDNVKEFPAAFTLDRCDGVPQFEVVSVPSAVGQAKFVSSLLSRPDISSDESTAVVLPDEQMLLPLLRSLPDSVGKVNVTMGYPMSSGSFYSLMEHVAELQLTARLSDGVIQFYHKPVWNIASENLFISLADEKTADTLRTVRNEGRYYINAGRLEGTPLLDVIFRRPFNVDDAPEVKVNSLERYLLEILDYIGTSISSGDNLRSRFALELDFAMEYSRTVNLLEASVLPVAPATFFRLLNGLLRSRSIPFKGEPLSGLQIMGPLEVRALDFDTLIILSMNEGVFPRRSLGSSFIPPFMRSGFSLPTYVYQDAVWAYYFYRMIQRPSKVYLVLDSRTEGLRSGEESRYVKQLELGYGISLKRSSTSAQPRSCPASGDIVKTEEDIALMHSKPLSASAIKKYLTCPVSFYYSFVKGLSPSDDVSERMDSGMTGNVYHAVMETLYGRKEVPSGKVTADYIEKCRKDTKRLADLVESFARRELKTDEIRGRDIIVCRMLRKYVESTLMRDREMLEEAHANHFEIVGIEENFGTCTIGKFKLKGRIDRMDRITADSLRIVDYKTGRVLKDDEDINDANAEKIADGIFDPDNASKALVAFQFFIYDYLVKNDENSNFRDACLINCVYSTRRLLASRPVNVPLNGKFYDRVLENLRKLLLEMDSREIPFSRCSQKKNCEYCEFRILCAR